MAAATTVPASPALTMVLEQLEALTHALTLAVVGCVVTYKAKGS